MTWKWRRIFSIAILVLVAAGILGVQVRIAGETQREVDKALEELKSGSQTELDRERARQEAIAKRIENRTKGDIAAAIAATIGLIVSLGGVAFAAIAFFESREKERQDRLAAAFSEALKRLVAEEPRERAVGAAGMIYFFAKDRADFHEQALAALIAAARNDQEVENVRDSLRLTIERGVRSIDNGQLRKVSWQKAQLHRIDLSGCDLSGLDLRNAALNDADLSGARLTGANLQKAQLNGANLARTKLAGALLMDADLAGASIAGANLPDTRIDGLKVHNLDVAGAKFGEAVSGWRDLPWEAARDWRRADFHPSIRGELDRKYGKAPPTLRVLMLVWEMPPKYVAGGTWTACYHLVRKLRQRGANVTVVAPWRREDIAGLPFGIEVPIVGLDIVPVADGSPDGGTAGPYGGTAGPYGGTAGPYGSGWSGPEGGGGWSSYAERYAGAAPGWSPYSSLSPAQYASPYGGTWEGAPYDGAVRIYGSYGSDPGTGGSTLYRLMGEFRRRLRHWIEDQHFDLIHAHDWVTFEAAQAAAKAGRRTGAKAEAIPWIAHFHSTEIERQVFMENPLAADIEREGASEAERIIAPGSFTAKVVHERYGVSEFKIAVIPNLLSEGAPPTFDMGRFEDKRVLFIGRLSEQKGVDLFIAAVDKARPLVEGRFEAEVVGSGLVDPNDWKPWIRRREAVPWDARGSAFRGASVVVVPSRYEPFGMVILEAMQHRVPVIYPERSGAAEVLQSGIKADPQDSEAVAGQIARLLNDLRTWEETVRDQSVEIEEYPDRGYEEQVISAWEVAVGMPKARALAAAAKSGAEPAEGG